MNWIPNLPMQVPALGDGGPDLFIPMMLGIGLIWYFLVIRPQNTKQREHDNALKSAKKGDRVVTTGGLHGKIVSVGENEYGVEIGKVKGGAAVQVQISQNRIESISSPGQGDGTSDSSDSSGKDTKNMKKDAKGGSGS